MQGRATGIDLDKKVVSIGEESVELLDPDYW